MFVFLEDTSYKLYDVYTLEANVGEDWSTSEASSEKYKCSVPVYHTSKELWCVDKKLLVSDTTIVVEGKGSIVGQEVIFSDKLYEGAKIQVSFLTETLGDKLVVYKIDGGKNEVELFNSGKYITGKKVFEVVLAESDHLFFEVKSKKEKSIWKLKFKVIYEWILQ